MKSCIKCGQQKDDSAFRPKRNACRECERAAVIRWGKQNREKKKAKQKRYYERHKEEFNRKVADYKRRNPEKHAKYVAKWQSDNRERFLERQREYRSENKEYLNQYSREWREENPERASVYRQSRRARSRNAGGEITAKAWSEIKGFYGNRCLRCGSREEESGLTIDHVIPLSKGGSNDASNIQPLCLECNMTKWTHCWDFRESYFEQAG